MSRPYDLKALRAAAEQAIEAAKENTDAFVSFIDWESLAIVVARYWADDDGDSGYVVTIEECADDDGPIRRFIADHLAAAGFPGVEVQTEW